MRVKDNSCNSPECQKFYLKETPIGVFSCERSKSFRDSFIIERLSWLLLSYALVSQRIFKKES